MLLVVPPFSCLLSLLFPFSPSLPVIKLLYLTRSLHWWWNLKFEIGVFRLRIGVRLKDLEVVVLVDCLPGASLGAWSVSVKTQKRSLWQENLLSTFSAEGGRSASTNPMASFSPSSFTAPKGSENYKTVESIGGAVCLCTLHVSTCRFLWKW